jgi:hypothetical protein
MSGVTEGRRGLNLHVGEWVEVRSLSEIMKTLDERQTLDGLPFMPEMLQYCGKRFRVYKVAHKTCDTIENYVIRRMDNAVHLEGVRCDGSGHGGCQAGCMVFWKDAWLRRVPRADGSASPGGAPSEPDASPTSLEALQRAARLPQGEGETEERYRCQATDLLKATQEVRHRDRCNPLFYVKDLTSGNVRIRDFVRYGLLAVIGTFVAYVGGRRFPRVDGRAGQMTPHEDLNLAAGDRVDVRSTSEIMPTLNAQQRNRGLFFDVEMLPYCGKSNLTVFRRVERIINEKDGRMMKLPNPCVILDGVVCTGMYSSSRMFCPRTIYPYWREIWLRRADPREG